MVGQKDLKLDEVLNQIEQLRGNVSAIANRLRTSRHTLYRFINGHETAKRALNDARETMLDNAESVLYSKVLDGDTQSLIFFLRTQGKGRGYVERQELAGLNDEPVKLIVEYKSNERT